ncbi:GPI transamidase component PIG-T [Melampsora americana]|nr:GPI transamidase component PIG-T [Melampsora americana]
MRLSNLQVNKFFGLVGLTRLSFCLTSSNPDIYDETLLLRPLPDGKLHARFNFSLQSSLPTTPAQLISVINDTFTQSNIQLRESDLIPPSFSELIHQFSVAEFGLSLSRGRWDDTRWAKPTSVAHPIDRKPRGAQVWAWLDRPEPEASSFNELNHEITHTSIINHNWAGLTNTLAGLFCASLGQLSQQAHITRPPPSLFPRRNQERFRTDTGEEIEAELFHGLLPLEQPCTENLSPVLRLLPCKGHAGLSMLVNPHRLFEANWQSIAVELRKGTRDGQAGMQLELIIESVLDPVRRDKSAGGSGKRDWSLKSTFDRSVERACPVARSSKIIVLDDPTAVVEPRAEANGLPINGLHSFDLMKAVLPLDLGMSWPSESHLVYPSSYTPSLVSIERFWSGTGQVDGRLGVEIKNNANQATEAVYIEQLPWWINVYIHTLTTTIDEKQRDDIVIKKHITPSRARQRPLTLSLTLKLPPKSCVRIDFEYTKSLLLYTEYASDANRGFDLPPAGLLISKTGERFWTTAGLIYLATPDFSMPYNVIIVTSTVMALFFGSVFNLLVREFKLVKLPKQKSRS